MTSDRLTSEIVRRWLDEGVTELPDRVLDAVLDTLPATRQRRRGFLGRLIGPSHPFALPAAAAAVMVVVAIIVGTLAAPGSAPLGGAPPPPTPSGTPLPILPDGFVELDAGRYSVPATFGVPFSVEVEDGWFSCTIGPREIGLCPGGTDETPAIAFSIIEAVLEDPCDESSRRTPGPRVEDLVEAISGLPGFRATEPEVVEVDGHPGLRFTVTAPAESACPAGLLTWATAERVNGVGAGEINELTVVEVDGIRVLIAVAYRPGETAARLAPVRQVLASVSFDR